MKTLTEKLNENFNGEPTLDKETVKRFIDDFSKGWYDMNKNDEIENVQKYYKRKYQDVDMSKKQAKEIIKEIKLKVEEIRAKVRERNK